MSEYTNHDEVIYVGILWEDRPRASWDLEEIHQEFQERLYRRPFYGIPCGLCGGAGHTIAGVCECQGELSQ